MKHYVNSKFIPKNYQQCTKTLMDNIADPNITFDEKGVCNYYHDYYKAEKANVFKGQHGKKKLEAIISKIKKDGKGKKYDCLLGVSGGVDSTYLAYMSKKWNLRPLVVHFDSGWNSELGIHNIEQIIQTLNYDLHTLVVNWEEFKDIQRSYFKASVVDIEVVTDHAMYSTLWKLAKEKGIKYILDGNNVVTEQMLPKAWVHPKMDLTNLLDIHSKFGTVKIKTYPTLSYYKFLRYLKVNKIKTVQLLNLMDYNKDDIIDTIKKELSWKEYSGKHYESTFTKFYQAYILPEKFGIDKRKAHLSNRICSGQITREAALEELSKPLYDINTLANEKEYVLKKLGFTEQEFDEIMKKEPVSHFNYKTDLEQKIKFEKLLKITKPVRKIFK